MSQAKVDKRKYEKKNRKKLEKQRKIRFAVKCVTTALIIGAIVGVPLGIKIYKEQPKIVGDSVLEAFIGTYIDENYASEISVLGSNTDGTEDTEEGTSEDEVTKALEDASGNNLQKVDADDVDEMLKTDSEETTESSEADSQE